MLAHKAVLRAAQRVTAPSPNIDACAKRVSLKAKTGGESSHVVWDTFTKRLRRRDAGEHKAKWGGWARSCT